MIEFFIALKFWGEDFHTLDWNPVQSWQTVISPLRLNENIVMDAGFMIRNSKKKQTYNQ